VSRCSKRYVHDWRSCPFAHPTENARRRDPRLVRYLPVPCPDYKRGICLRGDACSYSHGVYECWLHPAKYRTQLCKEGPHCRRPVCFFAHSVVDLRQPTHLWDGNNQAAAASHANNHAHGHSHGRGHGHGEGGGALQGGRLAPPPAGPTVTAPTATSVAAMLMQQAAGDGGRFSAFATAPGGSGGSLHGSAHGSGHGSLSSSSGGRRSEGEGGYRQQAAEEALNNANLGAVGGSLDLPRAPSAEMRLLGGNAGWPPAAAPSPPRSPSPEGDSSPLTPERHASDVPTAHMPAHLSAAPAALMAALAAPPPAAPPARTASLDLGALSVAPDPATAALSQRRMSLDSALQVQQQAHQQQMAAAAAAAAGGEGGGPGWSLAAGATVAAAMAGIPVNEQPLLPNHGPRMSNAVARKLGLAPTKPPAMPAPADVRAAPRGPRPPAPPGALPASPPAAASFDGLLSALNARASMDQHQQMAAAAALHHPAPAGPAPFAPPYAGLPPLPFVPGAEPMLPMAMPMAMPMPMAMAGPAGAGCGADPLGLHPALLNLVAANVAPGGLPGGKGLGGPPVDGAAMAHLLTSLQHQWALTPGAAPGFAGCAPPRFDAAPPHHAGQHGHHTGGAPRGGAPHRGSSDGMLGMTGLPHVNVSTLPLLELHDACSPCCSPPRSC
jgi:hypothetical protein